MAVIKTIAIVAGTAALAAAATMLLAAKPKSQPVPEQQAEFAQNVGPAAGPTAAFTQSSGTHRVFDADVRFFDMNGLASSNAVLTTEACTAHGAAQLFRTQQPIFGKRHRTKPQTKTAWAYLCSRAPDERLWHVHPDPVQLLLSNDAPTAFELTATDIRKNRAPGTNLIVQCVVCSKQEPAGDVPAPDAIKSVIGASEVRNLMLNEPIGPSAVVTSINGVPVDAARFLSSQRLASIQARIRNLPAGAHAYLVTQPFDQAKRWVSLLQPQNGLAGDRFVGTAVFGAPNESAKENFQRYWLSVIVSQQPIRAQGPRGGEAVAIPNTAWDGVIAPMLQPVSEEPVVVKRVTNPSPAVITLQVDGAETGQGALNGPPIPVDEYFNVFGEVDFPESRSDVDMSRDRAWVLVFKETQFGRTLQGAAQLPAWEGKAKIESAQWSLPWVSLTDAGKYVAVAVLTRGSDEPPKNVTDENVLAYSEPKLIDFKGASRQPGSVK